MMKRLFIFLVLIMHVVIIQAQEDVFIVLKGKTLAMPFQVKKLYGVWTNVETKAKISPAELTFRQKDTEMMKAAQEYDKEPKLTLQKANIGLLKSKNASLGVTIYTYSYKEIPGYLNLIGKSMHDLWMSRLKPNPKSHLILSNGESFYDAASKGEGTIEGKPVSFFFTTYVENETNVVIIYTVPKQNEAKNMVFFGETFGRDWDTGMSLDGGH